MLTDHKCNESIREELEQEFKIESRRNDKESKGRA
jgi:hypothetical protein